MINEKLPLDIKCRTVPDLLKHRADVHPNKLALIAQNGEGVQSRLTYLQLDQLTSKLAAGLVRSGLNRKDRVAVMMSNKMATECVLIWLAVNKIGAINVPVNPRYSVRDAEYILNHCEARFLVVEDENLQLAGEVKNNIAGLEVVIVVGGQNQATALNIKQVLANGKVSEFKTADLGEEDDANWLYTSGTTGHPKAVMHTHASAIATGIACGGALELNHTDIFQTTIPFFTSSGCHFSMMANLYYGSTLIFEPKFEVQDALASIESNRVTVYLGAPAAYIMMLNSGTITNYDLSSIRLLDYGGSSMPKNVIKQLYKAFPNAELRQTYGLTEAGPSGIYLSGKFALSKLGSVGNKPVPLTQFRIVDENDQKVHPGQIGEICYRGPSVMKGYYKDPKATAEILRDGWLHSGDLVVMDEDGFIFHVDRKKDIIIRGGFNIASVEIENTIYEHPGVLETAVIAKPDQIFGEDIKAYVVLKKGVICSESDIVDFCKARLSGFKVPKDIEFIESLPRNQMGKVLKKELRLRVAGKMPSND